MMKCLKLDLMSFFQAIRASVKRVLVDKLEHCNFKFYFNVNIRMIKYGMNDIYEEQRPHFRSVMETLLQSMGVK